MDCPTHGPTVAAVAWARHDSAFTRSFEDLVVLDAVIGNGNASIGRIRTNARGFHDPDAFITMIMLDRAGLTPPLPWAAA